MTTLNFRTSADIPTAPPGVLDTAGPSPAPEASPPVPLRRPPAPRRDRRRGSIPPETLPPAAAPVSQPTVNDLLDRYEREDVPRKAATTQLGYRSIFPAIRAQLGHVRLADLTPAHLRALRDTLLEQYPPGTVRRRLLTLSGALTAAVKDYEWLVDNPMRKIRMPAPCPSRVRFLNDAERQRLLVACQVSRNRSLYPVVLLALTTGARHGELLALRWRDVDLTVGTLTFPWTKNGETRTVPVVGLALQVLRQWRVRDRAPATWVFPRRDGQAHGWVGKAFRNAVKRVGITNFRFHDLRHNCASYLAMSGASQREIAEVLGHKTLQQSFKYTHLAPRHTADVVARMTNHFALHAIAPKETPDDQL